jgi:prepilin-type N-terminal cleavage/methylation domain-containing protein
MRAEIGPRGRSAGFSLIEVLTVLALIGLATILAVPRIDLDWYRIDAGVRAMGSQLLSAQRLAVKRQHNVVVAIDSAGSRIRIHQDSNSNGVVDGGEPVSWEPLATGVIFGAAGADAPALLGTASAISFTGRQNGMPALTFHRSGSASEEGGFLLTTRRAAARVGSTYNSRGVRVERATGRITWYRFVPPTWKRES